MFDIEAFRKKMEDLYKKGDVAAIDKYYEQTKKEIKKEMKDLLAKQEGCCGNYRLSTEDQIHFVLLTSEAGEVLNGATGFYRNINNWDKCFDNFNELFELIKESNEEGSVGHADVLVNFATALRMMGNTGLAENKFREAEAMFDKNEYEDPYDRATLYNNRAPLYLERMEYEKAIDDFRRAMFYLEKIPDAKRERALTLTGLGNAYIAIGDLETAEEKTDIAIALFEEIEEDVFYGSAINTKAQIVYMKGDYEKASELFVKAAEITKKYFGENEDYRICMHNFEICAEMARRENGKNTEKAEDE